MTAVGSPRSLIVTGVASLAVREPLTGPPGQARIIAVSPAAIYLELPPSAPEPRVLVVAAAGPSRLPNAVGVARDDLGRAAATAATSADEAWVGRGMVQAGELTVRVLRWWDPSPVLGPLSRVRVEQGAVALHRACTGPGPAGTGPAGAGPAGTGPAGPGQAGPGLAGPGLANHSLANHSLANHSLANHGAATALAACCAEGDLAGAVEAAEQLVGLGVGLVPDGDNMINGLLLALRLLGGAISGGTRAVWLADWLGAAVTSDAARRTTSLGATLLHCAAHGQASTEVSAVLHGLAGQEPLIPATRALLAAGQALGTGPGTGAGLAWGLVAGCRAAAALALPAR
jgi:hypothetical protein